MSAITGFSAMNSLGLNAAEIWAALSEGREGLTRIIRFNPDQYDCKSGGQITGFSDYCSLPSKLFPQTDISTRYALTLADDALAYAGDPHTAVDPYDWGVFTGATGGATEFGQRELANLHALGPKHVSAYQSFAWFYAVNTGQISIRNQAKGPSGVVITEASSGLDALLWANRKVEAGLTLALAGAADSPFSPWGYTALSASRMLTPTNYSPYAEDSAGFIAGEGGAFLVLERSGRSDSEPVGYLRGGASAFAGTVAALQETWEHVIAKALVSASVNIEQVDAVFVDGVGDMAWDRAELTALNNVFGSTSMPPLALPKRTFGRTLAACGPLDVAIALLCMQNGAIPGVISAMPAGDRRRSSGLTETRLENVLVLSSGLDTSVSSVVLSNTDHIN